MRKRKAGHRSWAPKGQKLSGHVGDIMSAEKRSGLMGRIRGKNTAPEVAIFDALSRRDLRFERHCRDLPGRPDVVFRRKKVAVFVDGDFWHGFRFPIWREKLSPRWQTKIEETRRRDQRNFRKLRSKGWKVLRIWEHQIETDVDKCVDRIADAIQG